MMLAATVQQNYDYEDGGKQRWWKESKNFDKKDDGSMTNCDLLIIPWIIVKLYSLNHSQTRWMTLWLYAQILSPNDRFWQT